MTMVEVEELPGKPGKKVVILERDQVLATMLEKDGGGWVMLKDEPLMELSPDIFAISITSQHLGDCGER